MKIIAKFDKVTPTEIFNVPYDSDYIVHFEKDDIADVAYDVYFNDDKECIGILPANEDLLKYYKDNTEKMFDSFHNSTDKQNRLEYAMGYLLNHLAFVSCTKYSNEIFHQSIKDKYEIIVKEHYQKWAEYKSKLAKDLNTDDADEAKSSMKKALTFNSDNILVNLETLSKCLLGTEKYLELKKYFESQRKLNYLNKRDDALPF